MTGQTLLDIDLGFRIRVRPRRVIDPKRRLVCLGLQHDLPERHLHIGMAGRRIVDFPAALDRAGRYFRQH